MTATALVQQAVQSARIGTRILVGRFLVLVCPQLVGVGLTRVRM